jgi:hypothetical protein
LSTTLLKGSRSGQTRERKSVFQELEINVRSCTAAEKGDEGMALKILARAEDMAGGKDNLDSHTHIKWKRINLLDSLDHLPPFRNLIQFYRIHDGELGPEVFVHPGLLEYGLKAISTVCFDQLDP